MTWWWEFWKIINIFLLIKWYFVVYFADSLHLRFIYITDKFLLNMLKILACKRYLSNSVWQMLLFKNLIIYHKHFEKWHFLYQRQIWMYRVLTFSCAYAGEHVQKSYFERFKIFIFNNKNLSIVEICVCTYVLTN